MRKFKRGFLDALVLMTKGAILAALGFGPTILAVFVQCGWWVLLSVVTIPCAAGCIYAWEK